MENILPLISLVWSAIAGLLAWLFVDRRTKQLEREKLDIENDKLKAEAAITTVDSVKTVMSEFHNLTTRFIQLQNKYDELLDSNRQRDAKDREKEGMIGGLQDQIDMLEQDLNKKVEIYHDNLATINGRFAESQSRINKLVDELAEAYNRTADLATKHRECEEWKLVHMELHGTEDNHHASEALYPG